ncbi:heavy metal-binding domain-containing protein [Enterococcus mundtii]|uniref:heavy metal-binding domain-containing protein n=1 Tax=Enterococcus mundtii TaxID=53346 RepID=UPI0038FC6FA9
MAQFKPSAVDGVDDPRINEVVLSTGNINQKYIVRDIVFVAECIKGDLFDPTFNSDDMFLTTKQKLKKKVLDYGANAVINCHFEYQQKPRDGKQIIELFAYGTVIQFVQTTIG